MHAISKKERLALLILSLAKSSKFNEPGLRINFLFSGERVLKRGRYILFYKKALSNVLEGVPLKNSFWGHVPRPQCSVYANHDGYSTDFNCTKGTVFQLSFLYLHEMHLGFHVAHAWYVQRKMYFLLRVMMQEGERWVELVPF